MSSSLERYAGHHNPTVRGAALERARAVSRSRRSRRGRRRASTIPPASSATRRGDAAAKGHVREAIEPLFELLARGEEPAARALAAMADADLVRKLGDQLGKVPDASLALCLGLVLRRADFGPDAARVEVVRAIGKIQDQAAVTALTDYIDATPKNPPRQSLRGREDGRSPRSGGAK